MSLKIFDVKPKKLQLYPLRLRSLFALGLYRGYFYKVLNVCPFDCTTFVGNGLVWPLSLRFTTPVGWLLSCQLNVLNKKKKKCRMMFETQKVRSQERMVSTWEKMQTSNGTGPGVRRSRRPLLASCTRCKYPMETSRKKEITSKTVTRS